MLVYKFIRFEHVIERATHCVVLCSVFNALSAALCVEQTVNELGNCAALVSSGDVRVHTMAWLDDVACCVNVNMVKRATLEADEAL